MIPDMKFCGARLWVDYRKPKMKLKERIYEYVGDRIMGDFTYHCFRPYKSIGGTMCMTYTQMVECLSVFKPFCIDTKSLGEYR